MVWARTKLTIWDYIFEPIKDLKINYSGKHPEKFYTKIKELMKTVFKVPHEHIQEQKYTFEKKKNSGKFRMNWEVTKPLDHFTYFIFNVKLSGSYEHGEGKASISIEPLLITEYPQDTVWQQNILYEMVRRFWHVTFYHKQRMRYLEYGKKLAVTFEHSLKHYGEELCREWSH